MRTTPRAGASMCCAYGCGAEGADRTDWRAHRRSADMHTSTTRAMCRHSSAHGCVLPLPIPRTDTDPDPDSDRDPT